MLVTIFHGMDGILKTATSSAVQTMVVEMTHQRLTHTFSVAYLRLAISSSFGDFNRLTVFTVLVSKLPLHPHVLLVKQSKLLRRLSETIHDLR